MWQLYLWSAWGCQILCHNSHVSGRCCLKQNLPTTRHHMIVTSMTVVLRMIHTNFNATTDPRPGQWKIKKTVRDESASSLQFTSCDLGISYFRRRVFSFSKQNSKPIFFGSQWFWNIFLRRMSYQLKASACFCNCLGSTTYSKIDVFFWSVENSQCAALQCSIPIRYGGVRNSTLVGHSRGIS